MGGRKASLDMMAKRKIHPPVKKNPYVNTITIRQAI
jgi:hypothetical protein